MKNLKILFFSLVLVGLLSTTATAQTATQDVTIVISDINAIAVSAGTVGMTINSATAGSSPTAVTDNSTSYALTTNGTNKKVTAALSADYAAGISLQLSLSAPTGGSSAGLTTLTTVAQDLVTGITKQADNSLSISYSASATAAADPNGAGEVQTVILTLTD